MKAEKIILGIDPGTNVMGYGVLRAVGNKAEMLHMGVIDMRKDHDPYLRLGKIHQQVTAIIDRFLPDEMAIEAPFFGKNVQSMLKLGRSQGVAIAAAKEQVAAMLQRLLRIDADEMPKLMDATDALGVAYCHFMQQGNPVSDTHYSGWKDFINKNQDKVSRIGH